MKDLILRTCTALVLSIIALSLSYMGGVAFKILVLAVAAFVLIEAQTMAKACYKPITTNLSWFFYVMVVLLLLFSIPEADILAAIGICTVILATFSRKEGFWPALGFVYALLPAACLCFIRSKYGFGLFYIFFIYAVVWATDIGAYFCGRLLGGPKLAPRFSPKKTWSGAVGGAVLALLCATLFFIFCCPVAVFHWGVLWTALVLSLVAQCGDIAESAVKRRFHVKDSSNFLPGHGGFMDRVDGLSIAAIVFYILQAWYPLVQSLVPAFSLRW